MRGRPAKNKEVVEVKENKAYEFTFITEMINDRIAPIEEKAQAIFDRLKININELTINDLEVIENRDPIIRQKLSIYEKERVPAIILMKIKQIEQRVNELMAKVNFISKNYDKEFDIIWDTTGLINDDDNNILDLWRKSGLSLKDINNQLKERYNIYIDDTTVSKWLHNTPKNNHANIRKLKCIILTELNNDKE